MLWGFPPFRPSAGYGTNSRSLKVKLWRDWLNREQHRCVVPAVAFAEPGKSTPKGAVEWRWFERADEQPFFFAGIWRRWTGDRGSKKTPNIGDHTSSRQ
jgi:putative SOS response-associated peptidase YedK